MSNPTSGTLRLSSGLEIELCNPSFIWSDDSRFLAVPQWRYRLGLQLRQRLVLVDTAERRVYQSKALAWFLQPKSFEAGVLIVVSEPTSSHPKQLLWRLPGDLHKFSMRPIRPIVPC